MLFSEMLFTPPIVGCTECKRVSHQHAQFVQDDQFWGHWAHKRQDTQGRVYYLSPEVMLGQATRIAWFARLSALQPHLLQGRKWIHGDDVNGVLGDSRPHAHQGTELIHGGKHHPLHHELLDAM